MDGGFGELEGDQELGLNKQERLEFLGNGPQYMGRFYSRAALVFWPRSHRPAVLEKSSEGHKYMMM